MKVSVYRFRKPRAELSVMNTGNRVGHIVTRHGIVEIAGFRSSTYYTVVVNGQTVTRVDFHSSPAQPPVVAKIIRVATSHARKAHA